MSLTSFLGPLWAPMDCSHRGQGKTLDTHGLGKGLGLLAGGLGWHAGLSCPTSLSPPCAGQPCPPMPPPPGLPLSPLYRLARALTCEIKRDFNYLSAKQQLERITAQQRPLLHSPCQVCLLPFFFSPYQL